MEVLELKIQYLKFLSSMGSPQQNEWDRGMNQ